MSAKLWQATVAADLHPLVEAYTVGSDITADQQLAGYDIQASMAHVMMLHSIGILTKQEEKQLITALTTLQTQWQTGSFQISSRDEDCHSAIEQYLTDRLGATGKKIHTARSRNDQSLVMLRLYMKDTLTQLQGLIDQLVIALRQKAEQAATTPMPGYTHMQKAMPTTVATWLSSYADSYSDLLGLLTSTLVILDQNPLGSAAGFGTNLAIDRQQTTDLLGFATVQANPMYCGLSRGIFELLAVQSLQPLMALAGKFANDMLLFTTQEFNFFSLPNSLTTGSSIMPHKHNYDLFEIMRGKSHIYGGYVQQLHTLVSGIGSGYQRDVQLSKTILLEAMSSAHATLEMVLLVVPELVIHRDVLEAAMTDDLQSVERVNTLVLQGVPFRDAYAAVKASLP